MICIIVASGAALVALLWKSRGRHNAVQWLDWAAILTWTLLLNVYVPFYDSVLVILAVVLMLGGLRGLGWHTAAEWTTLLAVILFAVSWVTIAFAKAHGLQLLSILLLVLGSMQLVFLRRAVGPEAVAAP